MLYRTYVFLHLVGVVLFFSGFTASLFLKARAERTGNLRILAYTFSLINFNDKWFTPASVLLILGSGFAAAQASHIPIAGTGWILWSLALYGLSGLIFVTRALPLQQRLERLTKDPPPSDGFDWANYRKVSVSWNRWATIAFLAVVGAFALMVFKPALTAFSLF